MRLSNTPGGTSMWCVDLLNAPSHSTMKMPDANLQSVSMPAAQRIPGRRFLHAPGPTPVPDEVLQAMSNQPMDLADPRMARIIENCETGLRRLLHTASADIYLYAANG